MDKWLRNIMWFLQDLEENAMSKKLTKMAEKYCPDWNSISYMIGENVGEMNQDTIDFISQNSTFLNWRIISNCSNFLTNHGTSPFQEYILWDVASRVHLHWTEKKALAEYLNWDIITNSNYLTLDDISHLSDYINWDILAVNPKFPQFDYVIHDGKEVRRLTGQELKNIMMPSLNNN